MPVSRKRKTGRRVAVPAIPDGTISWTGTCPIFTVREEGWVEGTFFRLSFDDKIGVRAILAALIPGFGDARTDALAISPPDGEAFDFWGYCVRHHPDESGAFFADLPAASTLGVGFGRLSPAELFLAERIIQGLWFADRADPARMLALSNHAADLADAGFGMDAGRLEEFGASFGPEFCRLAAKSAGWIVTEMENCRLEAAVSPAGGADGNLAPSPSV
jgi:hypothetical protein